MSRVRNRDTDLERAIRSQLHRRGHRFRKHVKSLPGSPDVVFTRLRIAVFIDGDFWHGYQFEEWRDSLPEFWKQKIERNRERDVRNHQELEDLGWVVVRLWQHEIERDLDGSVTRVIEAVQFRRELQKNVRHSR